MSKISGIGTQGGYGIEVAGLGGGALAKPTGGELLDGAPYLYSPPSTLKATPAAWMPTMREAATGGGVILLGLALLFWVNRK